MSEGCSIADRAAPASQLVTSYSPLHRFARPSSQGGEDEERNEDEKRCYGEVLPYIWLKSDIWKAVKKQEKSGQAWAMDHDLIINHGPWTT